MSDIEGENIPHMLPMMHDESLMLEPAQQKLLVRWAILKSMILDSAQKKRAHFYSDSERIEMKPPSRCLPVGTLAWIGRLPIRTTHAQLTDTFGNINNFPKAFRGCVTTIVVGHLVIQVVTLHVLPMFATQRIRPTHQPGTWDVKLLNVWPVFGAIKWPPPTSFELKGTDSIVGLFKRWNIGTEIDF